MQPVIKEIYDRFLVESADAEELQYGTHDEELSANLIHKNYMSLADLKICAATDVARHDAHPNAVVIAGLHAELQTIVAGEDALAA